MPSPHAPFAPDLERWRPWSPQEVAARFRNVNARWCIAAGWAIDLFLAGEAGEAREHEDIEIAVPAHEFELLSAALDDCDLFVVDSGLATPLAHASARLLAASHQTWVRDRTSGDWRLDVFREPSHDGKWVARRDSRIQLAYEELILVDANGIPFACPDVVLLFKAKALRPKDQLDFDRVLPRLDPRRRQWLLGALGLAHPGHPWLGPLAPGLQSQEAILPYKAGRRRPLMCCR